MEWPGELRRRLLFPFRRRQFDRDLEEEMRFHLDMKAREAGPAAAQKTFGNVERFQRRFAKTEGKMVLKKKETKTRPESKKSKVRILSTSPKRKKAAAASKKDTASKESPKKEQ